MNATQHQPTLFRKTIYLLLLLLLATAAAFAQGGTSVSGRVTAAGNQKPLSFATVALLHLPDSAATAATVTDADGTYTFTNILPGTYLVKAMLVSYTSRLSAPFSVKQQAVQVPALALQEASTILGEVEVTGRKPVVEQLADRLVMNVEQLNTAGDNALEVLTKAPGVQLDKDENILYRGSSSVQVMLNGRTTYMNGAELQAYLKSLPASAVSKIELISNPPAAFDAAGTAGIINIKLKRDETQGTNGTVNLGLGYGRYEKAFGGLNLNYNTGKLRLNTRLNGGHYNSYNRFTSARNINDTLFQQENYWQPTTRSINFAAGADYLLHNKHTIGIMLKGHDSPYEAMTTSETNSFDTQGSLFGRVNLVNPKINQDRNLGLNLNYRFEIDSTGRTLSLDADYVRTYNSMDEIFTNTYFSQAGDLQRAPELLRSSSQAAITIYALKADYVHPLGNGWRAETGWKSSWVRNDSNILFELLQEDQWVNDPRRTNHFIFDENINAAYLSLDKKLNKKLTLKAGLRGEQTISKGKSESAGDEVDRNFVQLFPSLFAGYSLNADNQFSISYSRRVGRPTYRNLNPFIFYTDRFFGIQGNPFLLPSYSNSLQAGFTHKNFQVLSLSYLQINDLIMEVVEQNDETKESISTPQNLNNSSTFTLSSGGTLPLSDWWSATIQLQGTYTKINTPLQGESFRNSQYSWSGNLDQNFTLPKDYTLQLTGFYQAPTIHGLFNTRSASSIDVGVKKTIWNDKATLSLKMRDMFNNSWFRSTLAYGNVDMVWQNEWESRRITLTFDYKFGNRKIKTVRNRKTGAAEEEDRL
ncbi:outer membrane beta-barrel family protein [Pontibacter sp. 13R65]|uniref:outer membrane beta-barrel family protein n=1 Tax=Pontibacter sp. 13R65 TaxID=3127458 RepID=UPI00301D3463